MTTDPIPSPVRHRSAVSLVSRRTLLAGAAVSGLLAACGSESSDGADDGESADGGSADGDAGGSPTPAGAGAGTWTLVQRFPQDVQVPGPVRLPMSLSTGNAQLVADGPETLGARVTDLDGNPIGEPISASRRDVAPGPYYDFRTTVEEAGVYYLVVEGGPEQGAAFQIMAPGTAAVAQPGEALEPFDTPTTDDARGVEPICTREPEPCPFHDVTLTEALATGRPVVYLVGTPAFCATGSCAPALEAMIDVQDDFGDTFVFVHAEVYTDDTATVPAPAVEAAGLTYEPALFVTGADGNVVERLDAVWDRTELVEVLSRVAG